MDLEDVKISQYDQRQLREIEIEVVSGIQEWGSSGYHTMQALQRAFQLGFTAVNRGEAEGQEHPPKPDWMTED